MRPSKTKTGFTLVELLVVIAIIGTLMGLLLPAVQSAREAGRRNTCTNNVSQLAKAIIGYDGQKGAIPGWRNKHPYTGLSGNGAFTVTWPITLLPFLERMDYYRSLETSGTSAPAPPAMAIFNCPTAPADSPTDPTIGYAANAGNGANILSPAASSTTQWKGDGLMVDRFGVPGSYSAASVSLDYISSKDGAANTLALAEKSSSNVQRAWWSGYQTTSINWGSVGSAAAPVFGLSGTTGLGTQFKAINSITGSAVGNLGLPSSNHPGGVVVAYSDGHTVFLKDTVSPWVYAQLVTSDSQWDGTAYATNSAWAREWLRQYVAAGNTAPYILSEADLQ